MCLCGPRLQVRSVRRTGSTSLLEYWRMPYRLGHETVDTAAGRASTPHTHTHLQRSRASTVSTLYIALLLPAPNGQGRASMPYSTLLPLPILLYRPDLPFLLPTPMSPLTWPYCQPLTLPKYLRCLPPWPVHLNHSLYILMQRRHLELSLNKR